MGSFFGLVARFEGFTVAELGGDFACAGRGGSDLVGVGGVDGVLVDAVRWPRGIADVGHRGLREGRLVGSPVVLGGAAVVGCVEV